MDRRSLFGILAATPTVAETLPVNINCVDVIKGSYYRNRKPYSMLDYATIKELWDTEYLKKLKGKSEGHILSYPNGYFVCRNPINEGRFLITHEDLFSEFASACLNGEVPGVFWE